MNQSFYFPFVVATLISALLVGSAMWPGISVLSGDEQPAKTDAAGKDVEPGNRTSHVSVKDFSHLVADGDWSPAIQAAIDHVSVKNGYENGATILFPPGTYKINKTARLEHEQTRGQGGV